MVKGEETVKGIILSAVSQGEYGRRLSMLTDRFGRITVFAGGAAKQNSALIGTCRPFVCGEFALASGKNARNLHSVRLIDSFDELTQDPETVFTASYVMEAASFFSDEGMPEEDARKMLNLLFVTLSALRGTPAVRSSSSRKEQDGSSPESGLPAFLIRRIFELRLLAQDGRYTSEPLWGGALCREAWVRVLNSALTSLYAPQFWQRLLADQGETDEFTASVKHLMNTQTDHHFRSADLL